MWSKSMMKLDWIPGSIFKQRKEEVTTEVELYDHSEDHKIKVRIEKVDPHAIIPTYAHHDDACCDLYIVEDYTIRSGQRLLLRTGIAIEIPTGYEVQIRPRSGLAWKHGLSLVNAPGTVDAQYRNEIKLLMINLGKKTVTLKRGDRAAQMCIKPVYTIKFREVDKLSDSDRGLGGWGSTGK
jgi:dUTP pyrophosphatase